MRFVPKLLKDNAKMIQSIISKDNLGGIIEKELGIFKEFLKFLQFVLGIVNIFELQD